MPLVCYSKDFIMDNERIFIFFKKIPLFCIVFFAVYSNKLYSTDFSYGGNFLKIPVPALTSGLAEAYTSMISADSILYNPAGIGLLTYSSVSTTYNRYIEGINQGYISGVINTPYGNFGVVYSALKSGDIVSYDENENITGKTSTSHSFYGIAYAKGFPYFDYAKNRIDPMLITPSWTRMKPVRVYIPKVYRFSFGFLVKRIEEKLDTESSSSLLFDGGALLILPGHFQLGASAQNIGGSQKFYQEKNDIPRVYRFGVSKDVATENNVMNFIFSLDYVNDQSEGSYINFGLEDDIAKTFQLRFGYTTRESEMSSMTAGMGMNFDKLLSKDSFLKGLRMDYAFMSYGIFGATHRIGFQMVW